MWHSKTIPSDCGTFSMLQCLTVFRRCKIALNPPTEADTPSPHVPAGPKKDYSLKEGQTFSISIPGRPNRASTGTGLPATNLLGDLSSLSSSGTSTSDSSGGIPLLPPPPSSNRKRG